MVTIRGVGLRVSNLAATLSEFFSTSRLSAGQVPVLCYHRVLPEYVESEIAGFSVLPEQFDAQMRFLTEHQFHALTFREYLHKAATHPNSLERSVLVTFDDGFSDNLLIAAPIAKKYGIALNLFLCTGFISGESAPIYSRLDATMAAHRSKYPELWRPLTWDELDIWTKSGNELGFHSHLHIDYGLQSIEGLEHDVALGLYAFESNLGYAPSAFAYPYGTPLSCPHVAEGILRRTGVKATFSTQLGSSSPSVVEGALPRILIYNSDSISVFRRKLFGHYDSFGNMRSLYQQLKAKQNRNKKDC